MVLDGKAKLCRRGLDKIMEDRRSGYEFAPGANWSRADNESDATTAQPYYPVSGFA